MNPASAPAIAKPTIIVPLMLMEPCDGRDTQRRDNSNSRRQAVDPVNQVERVGRRDEPENRERDVDRLVGEEVEMRAPIRRGRRSRPIPASVCSAAADRRRRRVIRPGTSRPQTDASQGRLWYGKRSRMPTNPIATTKPAITARPPSNAVGFSCGRSVEGCATIPKRTEAAFATGIIAAATRKADSGHERYFKPRGQFSSIGSARCWLRI